MRLLRASVVMLAGIALLMTAACGGKKGDGQYTVTVLDAGSSVEGAIILVHDGDGRLIAEGTTNLKGQATVPHGPGRLVSAAWVDVNGTYQIQTYVAPRDGEELVFGTLGNPWNVNALVNVTLPGTYTGATMYQVDNGCQNAFLLPDDVTEPVNLNSAPACLSDNGTGSVMALAYDGLGAPIAYATGGDVTIDGQWQNVKLSDWETDFETVDFEVNNPPTGATEFSFSQSVMIGEGTLFSIFADADTEIEDEIIGSYDMPAPGTLGDIMFSQVTSAEFGDLTNASDSMVAHFQRIATAPSDVTVDVDTMMLPHIKEVVSDQSTLARPALLWTKSEDIDADGTMLFFSWNNPINGSFPTFNWSVFGPPDMNQNFQVPRLPESMAHWRPSGSSSGVAYIAIDDVSGTDPVQNYNQFRAHAPQFFAPGGFLADSLPPGELEFRFVAAGPN